MTTYQLKKENGQYFTEPILNEEEWLQVLHSADNDQHRRQLDVLRMFLHQPGHKAACSVVGKEYSLNDTAVNSLVVHFCKFARKNSGKDFRVECHENTDDTYWPICMYGRNLKGDHFEWELRPELVAALRRFLLEKLLQEYRGPVIEEGLDNSRSEELYKWKVLSSVIGQGTEDILAFMGARNKGLNFITWRTQDAIRVALEEHRKELVECFSLLLGDGAFYERFDRFVAFGKTFLSKTETERILKEKEACLFLALSDPKNNPVYKWTLYKDAYTYLGIDPKASKPVDGYLDILHRIIELEAKDTELIEKLRQETSPYFWSELLNAQDVLFQMQAYMQTARPKNWLQNIYDKAIETNDSAFRDWYPSYKQSVELFQDMFTPGKKAEDIPEETIDFFIRAQDNHICNNAQGCITRDEYPEVRKLWPEIYELLKRNVDAGVINPIDFEDLQRIIRPALTLNRPLAYNRLWSGLFPEHLTTCCKDGDFTSMYDAVRHVDASLPQRKGNWLKDNLTLMEYLGDKVSFIEPWHRSIFARYLFNKRKSLIEDNETNHDMDKYIELLKANHNIVLSGAPGTGKTYLARQIAKALGDDNPGFVQFHPSYDYTDFVEGLRPNDEGSFERVNGTFKQFCAEALVTKDSGSFDSAYEKLINDLSVRTSPLVIKTGGSASATFGIMVNSRGNLDLFTRTRDFESSSAEAEYNKNGSLTKERVLDCDNQIYWKGYYVGVKNLLIEKYGLVEGKGDGHRKDRVFIIDEINRGELSKIFGELFFAIEPGYRGEKGRVKTQYQNLVEPGDPFEKGFFVPDNVYIIGTMNDIDRGVESMDFAVRRRFAWVEVKAKDRIAMWDENISDWREAAERSMTELNKALKLKEIGLTDAYDIGPAYYLKLEHYDGDFEKLWEYHIKVILSEYLRGSRGIEDKLALLKEAFDNYKEK